MNHIKKVTPRCDYCLEVAFDNGGSVILDLKSKLKTIRFGMLAEKGFFESVSTDGKCISWGGKVDLSIWEIFHLVQR